MMGIFIELVDNFSTWFDLAGRLVGADSPSKLDTVIELFSF